MMDMASRNLARNSFRGDTSTTTSNNMVDMLKQSLTSNSLSWLHFDAVDTLDEHAVILKGMVDFNDTVARKFHLIPLEGYQDVNEIVDRVRWFLQWVRRSSLWLRRAAQKYGHHCVRLARTIKDKAVQRQQAIDAMAAAWAEGEEAERNRIRAMLLKDPRKQTDKRIMQTYVQLHVDPVIKAEVVKEAYFRMRVKFHKVEHSHRTKVKELKEKYIQLRDEVSTYLEDASSQPPRSQQVSNENDSSEEMMMAAVSCSEHTLQDVEQARSAYLAALGETPQFQFTPTTIKHSYLLRLHKELLPKLRVSIAKQAATSTVSTEIVTTTATATTDITSRIEGNVSNSTTTSPEIVSEEGELEGEEEEDEEEEESIALPSSNDISLSGASEGYERSTDIFPSFHLPAMASPKKNATVSPTPFIPRKKPAQVISSSLSNASSTCNRCSDISEDRSMAEKQCPFWEISPPKRSTSRKGSMSPANGISLPLSFTGNRRLSSLVLPSARDYTAGGTTARNRLPEFSAPFSGKSPRLRTVLPEDLSRGHQERQRSSSSMSLASSTSSKPTVISSSCQFQPFQSQQASKASTRSHSCSRTFLEQLRRQVVVALVPSHPTGTGTTTLKSATATSTPIGCLNSVNNPTCSFSSGTVSSQRKSRMTAKNLSSRLPRTTPTSPVTSPLTSPTLSLFEVLPPISEPCEVKHLI